MIPTSLQITTIKKLNESLLNWELSKQIETEILDWAHQNQSYYHPKRALYAQKARSLIFNLGNTEKNPTLLENVISGEIKPPQLVNMTPHEMFPELCAKVLLRIAEQDKWRQISQQSSSHIQSEGLFKCRKCKSGDTSYVQFQTRSADEPMTNFHTCHNCGNRWKS